MTMFLLSCFHLLWFAELVYNNYSLQKTLSDVTKVPGDTLTGTFAKTRLQPCFIYFQTHKRSNVCFSLSFLKEAVNSWLKAFGFINVANVPGWEPQG